MSSWRIQHCVERWTWHVPVAAIQSECHSCVGLTIRAVMFQDQSKRTFNSAYLPRVSLLMYQKWSFSMFVVIAITSSAMNHWPSPTMIMNKHCWALIRASPGSLLNRAKIFACILCTLYRIHYATASFRVGAVPLIEPSISLLTVPVWRGLSDRKAGKFRSFYCFLSLLGNNAKQANYLTPKWNRTPRPA